jgi:hypothetical protein
VATLLRLANSDLKDAGLLSSGRSPANAPALVQLAFDRLTLAVMATERGWPLPSAAADLRVVPDANPLKATLTKIAKMQPALQPFPAVGQDGNPAPVSVREVIRAAILATSTLLKDLAGQFEVDLLGEGAAERASPVRPEPVLSPPPPSPPSKTAHPARRKAAPELVLAATKPRVDAPRAEPRKAERPAIVTSSPEPTPPPTQRTESHEIEGRSPIELTTSSNSTASTAFWALMDEWHVEDIEALALIGHPGGLTKKGTRPRFKLVGAEVAMFRGLKEIASALTSLQLEPQAWLNQPIRGAPFGGTTPIAYLTEQRLTGVRSTIRFILQQGLKLSVSASTNTLRSADGSHEGICKPIMPRVRPEHRVERNRI